MKGAHAFAVTVSSETEHVRRGGGWNEMQHTDGSRAVAVSVCSVRIQDIREVGNRVDPASFSQAGHSIRWQH